MKKINWKIKALNKYKTKLIEKGLSQTAIKSKLVSYNKRLSNLVKGQKASKEYSKFRQRTKLYNTKQTIREWKNLSKKALEYVNNNKELPKLLKRQLGAISLQKYKLDYLKEWYAGNRQSYEIRKDVWWKQKRHIKIGGEPRLQSNIINKSQSYSLQEYIQLYGENEDLKLSQLEIINKYGLLPLKQGAEFGYIDPSTGHVISLID